MECRQCTGLFRLGIAGWTDQSRPPPAMRGDVMTKQVTYTCDICSEKSDPLRMFGVHFIEKSVYNISELPSDLRRADVIAIAAIALVLAALATLYPAWKAARVNPAEALRYE